MRIALSQVLPQAYGGEAEMIPIETAVHARLVREGLEQAKSAPANAAADGASDSEGRLARAGRCVIVPPGHPCMPPCLPSAAPLRPLNPLA